MAAPNPLILPLGDRGLLVRFGDSLSDEANLAALGFARRAERTPLPGIVEIAPNLVSVLLKYDPALIDFDQLAGEVRLLLGASDLAAPVEGNTHRIAIKFDGPDLAEVAAALALSVPDFIAAHNAKPLRVLAIGFAPGFAYCGFHPEGLNLPRRTSIRPAVPAGSILFAAGQTAIAATEIPTGWHVLGQAIHPNVPLFSPGYTPIIAGDTVMFEAAP